MYYPIKNNLTGKLLTALWKLFTPNSPKQGVKYWQSQPYQELWMEISLCIWVQCMVNWGWQYCHLFILIEYIAKKAIISWAACYSSQRWNCSQRALLALKLKSLSLITTNKGERISTQLYSDHIINTSFQYTRCTPLLKKSAHHLHNEEGFPPTRCNWQNPTRM